MKIGTDASIQTCIAEGYTMMEYKKRDLFQKGMFNLHGYARFFSHYPDYVRKEMGLGIGDRRLLYDVTLTANDLWDIYLPKAASLDKCCGMDDRKFPRNEYDMLQLASDLMSYGLIDPI